MVATAERRRRGAASRRRAAWRKGIGRVTSYVVLIAGTAVFLIPFLWMVSSSLKTQVEVFIFPPRPFPEVFQWHNYADAMTAAPFGKYFLNSVFVCYMVVMGTAISSSMVGYGFARIRGWGSNVLFAIVLATMMLPGQVTMIPLYVLYSKLGWINTFLPLIVPSFFGSAFNIFLFRQFFRGISTEVTDAAKVDGCNHWRLYTRIAMPMSAAAVATVAIMAFMWSWNEFLTPLIYLNSQRLFTVPLGLAMLNSYYASNTPWHWLMAASVVAVLPVLFLFFVAQKAFIQGIVVTGIK